MGGLLGLPAGSSAWWSFLIQNRTQLLKTHSRDLNVSLPNCPLPVALFDAFDVPAGLFHKDGGKRCTLVSYPLANSKVCVQKTPLLSRGGS